MTLSMVPMTIPTTIPMATPATDPVLADPETALVTVPAPALGTIRTMAETGRKTRTRTAAATARGMAAARGMATAEAGAARAARRDRLGDGGCKNDKGNGKSDPDGDENGGADQPGGSGGEDQSDQDCNNGSGNDADGEDDNNGGGKGEGGRVSTWCSRWHHWGMASFPNSRPRRLRRTSGLRRAFAETSLQPSDLIAPLFLKEGIPAPVPISAMPGHSQHTLDSLIKEARELAELGVAGVILFGIPASKDPEGTESFNETGISQQGLALAEGRAR